MADTGTIPPQQPEMVDLYGTSTDGVVRRWSPDRGSIRRRIMHALLLYGLPVAGLMVRSHLGDPAWWLLMFTMVCYPTFFLNRLLRWCEFEVNDDGLRYSRRESPWRTIPWRAVTSANLQPGYFIAALLIGERSPVLVLSFAGYTRTEQAVLLATIRSRRARALTCADV